MYSHEHVKVKRLVLPLIESQGSLESATIIYFDKRTHVVKDNKFHTLDGAELDVYG